MKNAINALVFTLTLVAVCTGLFYISKFGVAAGKVEGRRDREQDAVNRGYGIFVYTNNERIFVWNEDRYITIPGVKYQTEFK